VGSGVLLYIRTQSEPFISGAADSPSPGYGDISAELSCNYPVCHQASSEMLFMALLLIKLTCVRALMWT